jgi:hypothetical protein
MASIIAVDSRRAYGCAFSIGGAAGAVIVNRRRARTPDVLTAALGAAAQGIANTLASIERGRGGVKFRSEATEQTVGPFTADAEDAPPNLDLVMLTYRDGAGWALSERAANFGPHACAIVVDPDVTGWEAVRSPAGIASALQALAPLLTVPV